MRATFAILFSVFYFTLSAQNLVRNGGFEPDNCPSGGTDLSTIASPWFQSPNYVDHFGPCSDPGAANTNNNVPPRTGDGNIGLYVYGESNSGADLRGYAIGQLSIYLAEGQLYRVSYWVRPVLVNPVGLNAGLDAPGFAFYESRSQMPQASTSYVNNDSAIYPSSPITDINGWTQVCLQYRAKGGELFIVLGSFKDDTEHNVQPIVNGSPVEEGYYLIDDLVVEPINEPILSGSVNICPGGEVEISVPAGLTNGMWDDGSTNLTRTVTAPGTYTYGYQDGICYRVDAIDVTEVNCTECSIYYPSAFTPNGDGLNDTWAPIFECDPIEYRLEVFDRLGNLMYKSYDHNAQWAPETDDQLGTYVYKLQVTYELYGENAYINKSGEVTLLK